MKNISIDVKGKKPKLQGFITDATNIDDESESGRINITDKDLVANSLSFTSSTSNAGEITVGAAIIGGCNFTLWNDSGKFDNYNWTNTVVSISLVYDNSVSVYMGYFYIVSHRESGDTIRVEALDAFKIMDIHQLYEVGITWPAPASEVLSAIANFSFTRGVALEGIDDISDIMIYDPEIDQMPLREAVSYIAQMCGKFATIRSTGIDALILHFGWYNTASAYAVGTTFSHDLRTDDITVSGVTISDSTGEHTVTSGDASSYMIEIADNPFINERNIDAVAEHIAPIVGLTFRPGSFAVENNAKIEAGDAIQINTRDEQNINTLATTITFKPFQLQESIVADCESEAGDIQISLANYIKRTVKEEVAKAGGNGGKGGLTPEDIYSIYRPSDWMTMPAAHADELYLLFLIPSGIDYNIAFDVYGVSGSTSRVLERVICETGISENGEFVEVTHDIVDGHINITVNSDDYGPLTETGMGQLIVKLYSASASITNVTASCAEIRNGCPDLGNYGSLASVRFLVSDLANTNSKFRSNGALVILNSKNLDTHRDARIFSPRLLSDYITENNDAEFTARSKYSGAAKLIYAGIDNKNENASLDLYNMFYGCQSMSRLEKFNIDCATLNAYGLLQGCSRLVYVPGFTVSGSADCDRMFYDCLDLVNVGKIRAADLKCNYMFNSCTMTSVNIGIIKTSVNYVFRNSSIRSITLEMGSGGVFGNATFTGCSSLERLNIIANDWAGSNLNLVDCRSLSRDAVVSLFNDLPTAGGSYTITLYSSVLASLTDADKAIATSKGYAIA